MPRFTAHYTDGSGTPPNSLVVKDGSDVIMSMPKDDLHQAGGGGNSDLATLVGWVPTIELVEREFWTPYGLQKEMGFDLVYFLLAPGDSKEVGRLVFNGIPLGNPFEVLDTYKTCEFQELTSPAVPSRVYPNGTYAPLVVYRSDTSDYNFCVAVGYDVMAFNHPFTIVYGATPAGAPALVSFRAQSATGAWSRIPANQTREYRVMIRINDRTNTPIGTGIDAPTEWLWTLRGYQQFFRRLHGKPNYRSMGGWDGRPVASFNTSHFDGPYPGEFPPRWWQNEGARPTTGTGYAKFRDAALGKRALGIERVIIWANSGWHAPDPLNPSLEPFNYPFRFASGVFDSDMSSIAQTTVGPAYRDLNLSGLQWGLWWGRCTQVNNSTDWANPNTAPLDLGDPADVALCFAEADIAVYQWGARLLGLDAYDFNTKPGDGLRWLRMLKARYPRVLFVTELALPDIYHTVVPTYIIQPSIGEVPVPFWLHAYLNPGSECFFQFTTDQPESERAAEIAQRGYSPLTGFTSSVDPMLAADRWTEIGESPISRFRLRSNRDTWRDRNFRSRSMLR